jgi:hypothetical protein
MDNVTVLFNIMHGLAVTCPFRSLVVRQNIGFISALLASGVVTGTTRLTYPPANLGISGSLYSSGVFVREPS